MNARDIASNTFDIDVDQLVQVDPQAASILHSASALLDRTFELRKKMDANGQAQSPLYVELGESHANPSDSLVQMLFLKGLKVNAEPFVVGMEQRERTALAHIIGNPKNEGVYFSKSLQRKWNEHNKNGDFRLQQGLIFDTSRLAPYSALTLKYQLLKEDVLVKCTDAAWHVNFLEDGSVKETTYLDPRDRKVQEAFRACNAAPQALEKASNTAMLVRDRHSTVEITGFAAEYKARFAVSIGGKAHFFGAKRSGGRAERPFAQSQTMQLRQGGATVIAAAVLDDMDGHRVPSDLKKTEGVSLLRLDGIPKAVVEVKPEDIWTSPETKWVNERLDNLGMAEYKISGSSEFIAPYRQKYEQQKQAFLDDVAHLIG